jgi:hypothetical protein
MKFLPLEINQQNVYAGFIKRFDALFIDFLILLPLIF